MVGEADFVGEFRVEESKLLQIFSGAANDRTEMQTVIMQGGKRVVGNDKQDCIVAMVLSVLDRKEVRA
jgi:hypothetical protein